ncbi:MAG: amino acid adenylation domain-containing protein, partial [Opitutaceae bacterium]|nr:amino acid adenylation domain-containing protein [Opitutaceae bacterium]
TLKDAPAVLELPTDLPRPPEQSNKGSIHEVGVEGVLLDRLKHLARECNTTLFVLLLAAYKILLRRYSQQSDILVGTPVSTRKHAQLEPLFGFFVNMVIVRTRIDSDLTVNDVIRITREETIQALSNQELPFEMLVKEMRPERNLSISPFFQVAFMYQQFGDHFGNFSGLELEQVSVNSGTSKYDLTLIPTESPDGLSLSLEYATDLYQQETAECMLGHYLEILEGIVDDASAQISQLELLPVDERKRLLDDWNATERPYAREDCLHVLFEQQVDLSPDAVALRLEDQSLTYSQLDERANRLANYLSKLGTEPDALVGICLERSPDMVVALLAVLKSGAAYVPLDPAYPADRIAYVLGDAKSPILVTQQSLLESLGEMPAKIVCLDRDSQSIEKCSSSRPKIFSEPNNLAYVIYTSGSTGRPKGVQIEHRAAVNFLQSMAREPGLDRQDILLAVTTLSFDIAVLELYLPLLKGAQVVVAPRETAIDADAIRKAIEEHGITIMQATPATWRMLIQSGWQGSGNLKVLCGGEAMPPDLAKELLPRCSELWNMYGPTETTVWSTCCRVENPEDIHIGRPIDNMQLYILDRALQPTPIGVPGELMIGGDGLARGYFERSELTEEKFIPNPFRHGKRIYRTGDLAKYRPDGTVECLGRVDFQVKIRGFRIELGEIEAVLSQQPGVEQAVAIAREDTPGDKRLVAYVQADAASKPSSDELREALRSKLPEYMIPVAFVTMDALPLTPNGKVDRKALPKPEQTGTQIPNGAFQAPQGESEQKLARILQSLLGIAQIGRDDNFFDVGGHSLMAVSLFNEIEQVFGIRLQLATLFRSGSVRQLAIELESDGKQPEEWSSLVPIQPQGSKPRFFCVHGAGGNVLFYRILSQKLGNDYPFYGLESQGQDARTRPLASIEEMARRYVEDIKSIQPTGPYHLGGYCLGGTIAYEMAQILQKEGEDVALLALLDTYNFALMERSSMISFLLQKTWFHLGNFTKVPLAGWFSYLSSKASVAKDGELSLLLDGLKNMFKKTPKVDSVHDSIHNLNHGASLKYKPSPYNGVVTSFKPKRNYSFYKDKSMGWKELAQAGLVEVEFNFNPHAMLVEPFVEELARELAARIK